MRLIVGLGNPGREYQDTRHNAGFMVIDRLIARHAKGETLRSRFSAGVVEASLPGAGRCLLLKPTTYMNLSGKSVLEACQFYKLDPSVHVLVVVDEVALPTGAIKLNASGGSGGHNGLRDIQRVLGSELYPRLRVGVSEPPPMIARADWVLGKFLEAERSALESALDKAADACETFAAEGIDAAMNRFNGSAQSQGQSSGWGAKDAGTDPGWGASGRQ